MKHIWKISGLLCLGLSACQPAQSTSPPVVSSPSASPQPTLSPSPEPTLTPSPAPSTSATPSPSVSPESSPEPGPVNPPTPTAEPSPEPGPTALPPLRFGQIKVIAGGGSEGSPENGMRAENMPFPPLVTGLASDAESNIWLLNANQGALGYITPLLKSSSSTQDIEYRLYWERIKNLQSPASMIRDPKSGVFYIVETYLSQILKADPKTGQVTTVAGNGLSSYNGDGPALERSLNLPSDIALDAEGNLYVADTGNHLIRKITPEGQMLTVAGQYILDTKAPNKDTAPSLTPEGATTGDGGPALSARLHTPQHIAASADGTLYVTGKFATIRRIQNGRIDRFVGSGTTGYNGSGIAANLAHLNEPTKLLVGPDNLLYFIDSGNLRVRRVRNAEPSPIIEDLAGSGQDMNFATARQDPLTAELKPTVMAFDAVGNLYIYDSTHRRVRQLERHNE